MDKIRRCTSAPRAGSPVATALAAGLIILGLAGVAAAGSGTHGDTAEVIQNSAVPDEGTVTVTCREIWRAGGEDDEVFFGNIGQVLTDDDGNLYLLDSQLSQVQVYSPDGEHLRTLGREGDGPGESRNPGDMFFLPDGTLGLIQTFPGKVTKLHLDGNPAGNLNYNSGSPQQGNFAILIRGLARGGNMVLAGIRMSFGQGGTQKQTYFLAACAEDGSERHSYVQKEHTIDYSNFVLDEASMDFLWVGRMALGPDGRVYAAPQRNSYAIYLYTPDGTPLHVITREYDSLQRNETQHRVAKLTIEAIGQNYPAPVQKITVQDTEPDISGLLVTADGRLWVQNSHGDNAEQAGIFTLLDEFDAAGRFTRQIRVACPGDPAHDAFYLLSGGRIVVVIGSLDAFWSQQGVAANNDEEEEVSPLEVICYAYDEEL